MIHLKVCKSWILEFNHLSVNAFRRRIIFISINNHFFLLVGNDRLQERLQDDTGLRRRRGENIETSYEFVKSSDQNISNSSSSQNTNSTDSSIYHQKISLSNDGR